MSPDAATTNRGRGIMAIVALASFCALGIMVARTLQSEHNATAEPIVATVIGHRTQHSPYCFVQTDLQLPGDRTDFVCNDYQHLPIGAAVPGWLVRFGRHYKFAPNRPAFAKDPS